MGQSNGQGDPPRACAAHHRARVGPQKREEKARGPKHARRDLSTRRAEEGLQSGYEQGQRQVDQPRPVRHEWGGRADAGQGGVEPRRTRDQFADPDKAHGVVGVAEPVDELGVKPATRDNEHEGCRAEGRRQQRLGGGAADCGGDRRACWQVGQGRSRSAFDALHTHGAAS